MKYNVARVIFFLLDILLISFLYLAILEVREYGAFLNLPQFEAYSFEKSYFFIVIISLTLLYEEIYFHNFDFWEETKLVIKALFLSFAIIFAFLVLTKTSDSFSRIFLLTYFLSIIIFLPIFKRGIKKFFSKFSFFRQKVKVIGNTEQKKELEQEFDKNWYLGLQNVNTKPEVIYIASRDLDIKTIHRYIQRYSQRIKNIYIIPYMENINFAHSQSIEYFNIRKSVIKVENNLLKYSNIILKDFFEKTLVLLILPLFLLLHAVISFLIKKYDKQKSALFIQRRLGKNNAIFNCYKYQTMYENSDLILEEYLLNNPEEIEYYNKYHKYKNDPRITKVGRFLRKTSLDEIPQFINVLKGEMSLIGPRPYMLKETSKLTSEINTILRVKPGISGLWQVSGRSELSFNERKKLDMWYIQNWSLWMDIVILIKTIKVVFLRDGAK